MKIKKLSLISFCVIVACSILISDHTSSYSMAKSPDTFSETAGYKKIDLRLREAWSTSVKEDGGNKILQCIMKTKSRISDSEKERLKSAGYKFRTVIGRIITGSLKAKDVPGVSNLDFVVAMELSTPMSLKGSR